MFRSENISCEFTQYARGLNLSLAKDQEDLVAALGRNFTYITECDEFCGLMMSKIIFDTKTHTLAPQPAPSVLSTYLPSMTWTLLGYEEEVEGPKNLEGMMLFIAQKLSKLAKLKFGDDDTFTTYLLVNYNSIRKGICNLKEYYRRNVPSLAKEDSEEKTFKRCLEIHETVTASAAFIAGYSSEEIRKLSGLFLNVSKVHDLLSLGINAPIKNMMSLGKTSYSEAYIERIFKKHNKFMGSCLKVDSELFPQVLVSLSSTLEQAYKNQYNSPNHHLEQFYLKILNNECFSELHMDVVAQLLDGKKWSESEDEFEIRRQSHPIMEALNYVHQKIKEIKKQPILEKKKEEIVNFLEVVDNGLHAFPPFKQIFNFALIYWHQIPAKNNPGLPFKYLGCYEIRDFITQVLLSFDDLNSIDLSDPVCRKKLLECAEPIIVVKFSKAAWFTNEQSPIDLNKLDSWLSLFPEVTQLACWHLIEEFYQVNNLRLPF